MQLHRRAGDGADGAPAELNAVLSDDRGRTGSMESAVADGDGGPCAIRREAILLVVVDLGPDHRALCSLDEGNGDAVLGARVCRLVAHLEGRAVLYVQRRARAPRDDREVDRAVHARIDDGVWHRVVVVR